MSTQCPKCGFKSRPLRRVPDPRWFAVVVRGDVLKRNGLQRRAVRVSRRESGALLSVNFQKLRPSQYDNPLTCYTASDLKTLGYRYVGRSAIR